MNESRSESEKKTLKELLIEINNRHGMTDGNSYVAREEFIINYSNVVLS